MVYTSTRCLPHGVMHFALMHNIDALNMYQCTGSIQSEGRFFCDVCMPERDSTVIFAVLAWYKLSMVLASAIIRLASYNIIRQ